jgi:hypothetical protein
VVRPRYECQKAIGVWRVWDWARQLSLGEYDDRYPAHRGACRRYARDLNEGRR